MTPANPFSYTTVDAGPQPGDTAPTAINDTGQILGYYFGNAPTTNFLDSKGSISVLTLPVPYDEFHGTSINNAGQIIGSYSSNELGPKGFQAGFLYSNGALTTINVPGSTLPPYFPQGSTGANGINNQGQIAGGYSLNQGSGGYLYSSGQFVALNYPLPGYVGAAINNSGAIAGRIGSDGFIYVNGGLTLLSAPGAFTTVASGINDLGQVAASFLDNTGFQGFLYENSTYYVMNLAGSAANGINDYGQIVGSYSTPNDQEHGFIATLAAPEPASLTICILGVAFVSVLRMRTRPNAG